MTQPPDAAHETNDPPPQSTHPAPSPPPSPPRGERRMAVRIGIAMAALLFVAAAGLLYLRWATMREPTCIFILEASQSMRGAEVMVDGVKLVQPHKSTIGAGERFAIPFYLEYGKYSVRLTMNGATIYENEVVFDETKPYQRLDLTHYTPPHTPRAATSPSSSPSWLATPGSGFTP
jgi:hypothetical protein